MVCTHRLLLDCCRETYGVGRYPSLQHSFAGEFSGRITGAGADAVFEKDQDLATFRYLPGGGRDGRDLCILAFRGTQPPQNTRKMDLLMAITRDWLQNNTAMPVPVSEPPGAHIHLGFKTAWSNLWVAPNAAGEQLGRVIDAARAAGAELQITGHSKGGAVANVAAWSLVKDHGWAPSDIHVVTFAAARCGNAGFARAFGETFGTGGRTVGYEIIEDIVPDLPPGPNSDLVKPLADMLTKGLTSVHMEYVPVGESIRGHMDTSGLDVLQLSDLAPGFARTVLNAMLKHVDTDIYVPTMPFLIKAHDISVGGGYSLLVCSGHDGQCAHQL